MSFESVRGRGTYEYVPSAVLKPKLPLMSVPYNFMYIKSDATLYQLSGEKHPGMP